MTGNRLTKSASYKILPRIITSIRNNVKTDGDNDNDYQNKTGTAKDIFALNAVANLFLTLSKPLCCFSLFGTGGNKKLSVYLLPRVAT